MDGYILGINTTINVEKEFIKFLYEQNYDCRT
jgi:hypothetical protein